MTRASPSPLQPASTTGVSPYTPWTSNCFPQALVAKYWLRQRHIPTTLYLGVALTKTADAPRAEMAAHAWLRCGPLIVTGGRGHERFTTVAHFGDQERPASRRTV